MKLFQRRQEEGSGGSKAGSACCCAPALPGKDRPESLAPLSCYLSVAIFAGIAAMGALVFGAIGLRIFRSFRRQTGNGGVVY
ncbi:MAG: hypothetical protein WCH05_04825 [Chlorobiaceae bacterium]